MFQHQHIRFPSLHVLAHSGPNLKSRSDHGTDKTHQIPEAAAEKASRFLIRAVPLIYGASLGGFTSHLWLGLSVGITASAMLDLRLKEKSLIRAWLQGLRSRFQAVQSLTATKFFAGLADLGHRFPHVSLPDSHTPFGDNQPT